MIAFMILGVVVGIVAVVFVLQNITPVTVGVLFWDFGGSLSIVLLVTLFIGMLTTALIVLPSLIKTRWELGVLRKQNKKLQDALMIDETPKPSSAEPSPVEGEVVDL